MPVLAAIDPAIVVALIGLLGVCVTAGTGVLIAWLQRDARREQAALERRLKELETQLKGSES